MPALPGALMSVLTASTVMTAVNSPGLEIRLVEQEGRKTIEFENSFYRMILVPELARLPLTYYFKITGHDLLMPPDTPPSTVSLATPNKGFVYYGGLIDSIPWVSGKDIDGNSLAVKGYLYSCAWDWTTGRSDKAVWFLGETSFDYNDPVTREKAALFFQKRVTGFKDSVQVQMDYLIKNTDKTKARFTFDAHSRTAVAGYDAGDYFYAPGKECWVYELFNMAELEARGIKLDTWTSWPLKEATDYNPSKATTYIMVYLPADWCVVGDEKHKEALFFVASPVKIGGKTSQMKMGIFMTNAGYVVQPCLSYSLQSHPDRWERPGETVALEPGEECVFTLNLVPYQGINREELKGIYMVYPDAIMITEPSLTDVAGKISLRGKVALSAKGKLQVKARGNVLQEQPVAPGVFDLAALGTIPPHGNDDLSLVYRTEAGSRELYAFAAAPGPWKSGWLYRRRLTFDHRQVAETDQENFPVLVSLKDSALKSAALGGRVNDPEGRDIMFTAADGQTALDHEIESYAADSGELRGWVKVPVLSRSKDTAIYLYYGNNTPQPGQNARRVWDSGHRAVLHFGKTAGGTTPDSTAEKNNAAARAAIKDCPAGKIGAGCELDGKPDGLEITGLAGKNAEALTVEAWVNSAQPAAETMQTVIAKWAPQESFNSFDAYDAGNTMGLDTRGFLGAVFDGRYLYFLPQHNSTNRHGICLRYDTQKNFHAAESWSAYDAENTSGLVTKGYYGAVYDGRYVYYVPRNDGKAFHTRVLRFDASGDFRDKRFWQAYDAGLGISYQSAAFDGRYIYFCPGTGNVGGHSGVVLRYDTFAPFTAPASWKTYDAGKTGGLQTVDFDGAVYDGRYVYFVPLSHNAVLRYDTRADFEKPESWAAFDAGPLGMRRCVGGVFDGQYVYFVAYANNIMVRYDISKEFISAASWCAYDVKKTAGLRQYGYDGGFFDGRYVYFVPFMQDKEGKGFHCDALRYDTSGCFDDPAAWQVADAGNTAGLRTVGYNGGAFDGRYFYFAPWHDGVAYEAEGKIVGHGRVLRYDTVGKNGSFIMKLIDYGHNGGLCAAVCGPTFTVNTEKGPVTARDHRIPDAGWHHLAGVYGGQTLKLFVDGCLVSEQAAGGRLQNNDIAITVGRITGGAGYFKGMLDELRISDVPRSDGWIKTSFANQSNPSAFYRVGAEEKSGQ